MNSMALELTSMIGARGMAPVSSLARANLRYHSANDPLACKPSSKDILAMLALADTPLTTDNIASLAEITKGQAKDIMMSLKKSKKVTQIKTTVEQTVSNNGKTYQRKFTLSLWTIKREVAA